MMKVVIFAILIVGLSASFDHFRSVNHLQTIEQINQKSTTWTAGHNERFTDMNVSEVKHLLGALYTPEEERLAFKEVEVLADLPESFDLREAWPQCESLREVRDQSNCGSCWAFGAASAMSDRICVASNGTLQTRVSSENILSCCTSCGYGCNGGFPSAAWSFWQRTGVPTGGLYGNNATCQPYSFPPCDHHVVGKYGPCGGEEFDTPECHNTCNSEYTTPYKQDLTYATSAYSVRNNEQAIMTELFQHGSVEVAFTVYEDFLNYKTGVYQHVHGSALGGHAVKMIGWGVENGTKYWTIVNSWNEGWGNQGTFRILRGKNHCGIESEVVAGIPKL